MSPGDLQSLADRAAAGGPAGVLPWVAMVDKLVRHFMPGEGSGVDSRMVDDVLVEAAHLLAFGELPAAVLGDVCIAKGEHKPGCRFMRAVHSAVPIPCDEHDLDICPTCDKCDCGTEAVAALSEQG